jgi:hypothetical protein
MGKYQDDYKRGAWTPEVSILLLQALQIIMIAAVQLTEPFKITFLCSEKQTNNSTILPS